MADRYIQLGLRVVYGGSLSFRRYTNLNTDEMELSANVLEGEKDGYKNEFTPTRA
jgi:hypothetical protein